MMDLIQLEIAPIGPPSPKTPPRINTKWIGWRVAEFWPFEIFQSEWMGPQVGRQ